MKEIDLLDFISTARIEFGIFDSEGIQQVEVQILNTDNSFTSQEISIHDIMYFTEYGTITIPSRHILERMLTPINNFLTNEIGLLIDDVFEKDINETYIVRFFQEICLKIENIVKSYMYTFIDKSNYLNKLLNLKKDDNIYLYNLIDLSKYIKCKVNFEN